VARTNRQGSAHFPDPFGHVRKATVARSLYVEASPVIADTRTDAPLVAVKLNHHCMSRGMFGDVLQRLHAAEVQGELNVGRVSAQSAAHELDR
jgi:hypothetical protein